MQPTTMAALAAIFVGGAVIAQSFKIWRLTNRVAKLEIIAKDAAAIRSYYRDAD